MSIRKLLIFSKRQALAATLKTQLRLNDAIHRAYILAARGIVVTDTFHTSGSVDDVDGITFGDGFGRAFRKTGSAGNAIILNFHSHGKTLLS
jgi:hypothetical protein